MKLEMLDIDRFIKENDVKEVTNTIFFNGILPAENGLFCNLIFGFMEDEQRSKYGYIDLKDNYIHPLVVINLMRMGSLGSLLLQHDSIKKKWAKVVDGKIIYVSKEDPEAKTGKEFFYDNFEKIDWDKSLSRVKVKPEEDNEVDPSDENYLDDTDMVIDGIKELEDKLDDEMVDYSVTKQGRIKFIKSLSKKEFFVNKWLVIPKGYRNISSESRTLGSDINKEYRKLLTNINALTRFNSSAIMGIAKIQEYLIQSVILVNLFRDTIGFVTGKRVDFDKSTNKPAPTVGVAKNSNLQERILGKSIDYSSRNVIIAPTMSTKNSYKDVDALAGYSGIPLGTVCSSFLPFVLKYAVDIIRDLEMSIERQLLKWDENFIRIEPVPKLYIEKLLKSFIKSDAGRFDGYNFSLVFKGENGLPERREHKLIVNVAKNRSDFKNRTYGKRYFTVTDLFYQAAIKAVDGRYALLCRYPVLNHLNIFPTAINVLSTKEEEKNVYLLYNFNINWDDSNVPNEALLYFEKYPSIPLFKKGSNTELEDTTEKNTFINALITGNTTLKSIGGDYDGDTLSVIGLFSEEANKEARDYINSAGFYMMTTNKASRGINDVGKEYKMGIYMLTKD